MKEPLRVAVTGAAGNIAYSLLWMLANGDCFGKDQPIELHLLEITPALDKLRGVVMELEDSAPPLVRKVVATDSAEVAFEGIHAAFLVGSRPRTKDMNRADLIRANGPIFVGQGQALDRVARRDVKVIVVGNPCNTNALIAMHAAKGLDRSCFSAMTRLDHNRALGQLASKGGAVVADVRDVAVFGNHSDTMYPDVSRAFIGDAPVASKFDREWLQGAFLKTVAGRGKQIIEARGASSAASAAQAAVDHMHDWFLGSNGRVVSMAIPSKGWYGVPDGLMFSFPVVCHGGGKIEVLTDFDLDAFGKQKVADNVAELESEKSAVADLLG
jgi:malate dehydrogenase